MFTLPKLQDIPHTYSSPTGRIWRFGADQLGLGSTAHKSFVVRRLGACDSVLGTSAILGRAASSESNVSRPPTHWKPTPEGFFIATPMDTEAQPLADLRSEARTFEESLELWRPIAMAVQNTHSKGLVHGNVNPWSVWISNGRPLLLDAGTWFADTIPVSQWWPDSVRVGQAFKRAPAYSDDIANLARLLVFLHNGGDPNATPAMETLPGWAIAPLSAALQKSQVFQRVADLTRSLAPTPVQGLSAQGDSTSILYGRVSLVEQITHPSKGEGIRFWLTYPAYQNDGSRAGMAEPQGAFFYRATHGDVYQSVSNVWDGAELNILDALEVHDSQGRGFLTARPETLPVIEPHWPVSVTKVLKADGCVSRFLVDSREDELPNRHLVFGSMVHEFLERARTSKDLEFSTLWNELLPVYRLRFLASGLADDDLESFEQDAKTHFSNIQGFAQGHEQRGSGPRQTWSGDYVEVTRYSSIYGLEGRIDLVTEDEQNGLQIVELKTGSAREEHLTQVRSYKLLWEALAEEQKTSISGYLLYSRDALLRSTPLEDPLRERRILRARNALVAYHRTAAISARIVPQYHMEVPTDCTNRVCKFRKNSCARQTNILGFGAQQPDKATWGSFDPELIHRSQIWWAHFNRLIEMENWVEGESLGMMLQTGRWQERVDSFRATQKLSLERIDQSSGRVVFRGEHRGIFHPKDTVIAHRNDFHGSHIIRGKVYEITSDSITLSTHGLPDPRGLRTEGWVLDVLPLRIGYTTAQRAIYTILNQQRTDLFEVLFRPESARAKQLVTDTRDSGHEIPVSVDLNLAQQRALLAGLNAPLGCLIQGPPGTGKTTVIAHLVHALAAQGLKVLVAAQTNTAVDTMLSRIIDVGHMGFVRVGSSEDHVTLSEKLQRLGHDPETFFADTLGQSVSSLKALQRRILESPLIGVTAHRAGSSDLMHLVLRARGPIPFDVVIIDEATQLTEPMVMAAIARARRFVLVGDHRQLPPVVRHENLMTPFHEHLTRTRLSAAAPQLDLFGSAVATAFDPMNLQGLDQSLFERLVESGLPYTMLTEQFRMHQSIMAFSNREFYNGELKPHSSVATRTLENNTEGTLGVLRTIVEPAHPIVFVDVTPDDLVAGRANSAEGKAAISIVETLIKTGVRGRDIGVITPFRAQVHLIRGLLLDHQIADVDVDTVERYQGSERDVIIISFVKTERASEFISDARRLNVSLTRARKKLIILGHRGCLIMDPLMRGLVEQVETEHVQWETPTKTS